MTYMFLREVLYLQVKKHRVVIYPILFLAGVFLFLSHSIPVELPTEKNCQILYPSPHGGTLRTVYARAIKSAKKLIFLSTYTLSDPIIIKLLNQKAAQGVSIHIVTEKKGNLPLKKQLSSSISLCLEQGKGLMHEKILIVDKQILFLGTANMTYASLLIHDNLVLGLYDPPLAAAYLDNPQKRGRTIHGTQGNISLLPDPSGKQLELLQKTLLTTSKTLDIALFTFTHPLLQKTLIDLAQKKIYITCAIDKNTSKGKNRHLFTHLLKHDISLYTSTQRRLLHHKWALIDENTLILGSANWTKAAFSKNKDFFMIINLNENNKIILKSYWNKLINSCNYH